MLNILFFFKFVLIFSIIARRKEKLKIPFDENYKKYEEKVLNSAREQKTKNAVATIGREPSVETVAAYIKLGGCTEVIPDDKLLQWADGREGFQDIGEGTIDRAHAIRARINAENKNLTYEQVEERNGRGQEIPHREHMENREKDNKIFK